MAKLIKEKGISKVIPYIDHGRVPYFVNLWIEYENRPQWMTDVITIFGESLKMNLSKLKPI